METITFLVPDMQSSHCMKRVEDAIKKIPHVSVEQLVPGEAKLKLDPAETMIHTVLEAIIEAGYTPAVKHDAEQLLRFKTNINCSGCVGKVKPFLDKAGLKDNWEVDLKNPDRILTVKAGASETSAVEEAVKVAGFTIHSL